MKRRTLHLRVDDNMRFRFGDRVFRYSLYFMDLDPTTITSNAEIFKKWFLDEWAVVIKESSTGVEYLFLPFLPDDQWTECFMARFNRNNVILSLVRTVTPGYQIDFSNLKGFITSDHICLDETSELVGEFSKSELVEALLNAQVVEDVAVNSTL